MSSTKNRRWLLITYIHPNEEKLHGGLYFTRNFTTRMVAYTPDTAVDGTLRDHPSRATTAIIQSHAKVFLSRALVMMPYIIYLSISKSRCPVAACCGAAVEATTNNSTSARRSTPNVRISSFSEKRQRLTMRSRSMRSGINSCLRIPRSRPRTAIIFLSSKRFETGSLRAYPTLDAGGSRGVVGCPPAKKLKV